MKGRGENPVKKRKCCGIDEDTVAPYSRLLMCNLFSGNHVTDCDA
jgi:hypothetical protein